MCMHTPCGRLSNSMLCEKKTNGNILYDFIYVVAKPNYSNRKQISGCHGSEKETSCRKALGTFIKWKTVLCLGCGDYATVCNY